MTVLAPVLLVLVVLLVAGATVAELCRNLPAVLLVAGAPPLAGDHERRTAPPWRLTAGPAREHRMDAAELVAAPASALERPRERPS